MVALHVVPGDAVARVESVEHGQTVLLTGTVVRLRTVVAARLSPAVFAHRRAPTAVPGELVSPSARAARPDVFLICREGGGGASGRQTDRGLTNQLGCYFSAYFILLINALISN